MYFDIFHKNFILNFLPSVVFILGIYLSCNILYEKLSKNNISFFGRLGPVVCFFYSFLIFATLINFFLVFDKIYLISFVITIFSVLLFLILIFNIKKIYNSALKIKIPINGTAILIFLFFLISILPLSDSDSVASHLYFPIKVILNDNLDFNSIQDLEIISYSNNEIILFFSLIFKSDNFGSILNFFTLLLFYIYFNQKKNFFLILITSPVILFLISTQKLQLFYSLMYLLIAIIILEKKYSSSLEKNLIICLIVFYSTGKIYYLLFVFPILIIFLLQNKYEIISISFKFLISFFLIYFPILFLKFKLFNDPFAPFLSNVIDTGDVNKALSSSLRSSEGWINNNFEISFLFKPFLNLKINEYTTSLGLFFLVSLFNFKDMKNIYYLPYILIFLIIITGQFLPRYYFEAFILCSYFCKFDEF